MVIRTSLGLVAAASLIGAGTVPIVLAQTSGPNQPIAAPAAAPPETGPTGQPDPTTFADPLMRSLPRVDSLSDIPPDHWANQYVKTLNQRYNLNLGDADGKFRGNAPLTRDEFAAILSQVFVQLETFRDLEQDELNVLQGFLDSYRAALSDLWIRVGELPMPQDFPKVDELTAPSVVQNDRPKADGLTARTAQLVQQNVSPTTKLQTQVVQTLTDGTDASTTAISRVRLNLLSSFSIADQLVTQLEFGNNGQDAITKAQEQKGNAISTLGFLAAGGGLIEVGIPPQGRIRKLYYEFPVGKTVRLAVGSSLPPSDFIDRNRFANDSGANFGSSFFANNPLIVQNTINREGGAGFAAEWQLSPQVQLRGLYVAKANVPQSAGGLFGDRYQATLEAAYQPHKNVAIRWQYTNAQVNGANINALGLNAEWAPRRELALFGRLGFGRYDNVSIAAAANRDLKPYSWMMGATLQNLLITGSKVGLAVGQPFVAADFGNATQTNAEAYFSFLLNDKINLIPSLQVVSNPENQRSSTIWQWILRVVIDF
jgi:hypothetical protein